MALPIVKRYLIAFEQYKWVGLVTFTVAVGVSGVVALQKAPAPLYTASGTLTYRRPSVIFSTTGSKIQEQGQELTRDMLMDKQVVEAAAALARVNPKKLNDKNVTIKTPKPSDNPPLIQISYKDTDRKRSEVVVDALMAEMVKQSRSINTSRLREIIQQINKRLPEVFQELRTAEERLEVYEKREGASILEAQSRTLPQAITASEQQQRQIRLQLEGIEVQIKSLEARLGLSANQAYVAQALAADPIIAQLRIQLYSVESQLEILRKDLRDEHPKIVDLLKQKQALDEQLQQRAAEVLGGNGVAAPLREAAQIRVDAALDPARQQLAQTLINLQTQRESLKQQLLGAAKTEEELRRQHATIPNKQAEQARLAQQVTLKKALYDKMQLSLVDAQAAVAETAGSLAVAKSAQAPDVESNQKSLPVMLAVGGFVGVLLSGGLIFVLGMLGGKFYSWEEVRGALQEQDVQLLGILPKVAVFDPDSPEMPVIVEWHSPYLEFYERWRTNLRRVGGKALKVVLLTSAASLEGKSFCAYNLAIASARAGKRTLLIEADLRSPSQADCLQVQVDFPLEPLRYYSNFNECIQIAPAVENLYIVPSPGPLQQTAAVLESSEMRHLLEDARHRFDFVVIDAPALSACNDALTLEPYTDGIVLVARPGYTVSSMLAEATEQLTESDEETNQSQPRLLGAIINGADISVELRDVEEDLYSFPANGNGAVALNSHPIPKVKTKLRR